MFTLAIEANQKCNGEATGEKPDASGRSPQKREERVR